MGLKRFAPDFLGDPGSIYNLVHERTCLFLFEQIATQYGYAFMECDLSQLESSALLTLLYRNYVYGYLKEMVKKEQKSPGRASEDRDRQLVYSRRKDVRSLRFPHLICDSQIQSLPLVASK